MPGVGRVRGDVAWGGNWFFLVGEHGQRLELAQVEVLRAFAWEVRRAVNEQGYPEVDHVELFGPSSREAQTREFRALPGQGV